MSLYLTIVPVIETTGAVGIKERLLVNIKGCRVWM